MDVLVLLDSPLPTGCLIMGRALGVLELEQKTAEKTLRNDRIIILPSAPGAAGPIQSFTDLRPSLLRQMEEFFVGYAKQEGKVIVPVGRGDGRRAYEIIEAAAKKA